MARILATKSQVLKQMVMSSHMKINETLTFVKQQCKAIKENEDDPEKLSVLQILNSCIVKAISHNNDIKDSVALFDNQLTSDDQKFKLSEVFTEVIEVFRASAKSTQSSVNLGWGSNIPRYLVGDRHRLQQVMIKLISNAFKFC